MPLDWHKNRASANQNTLFFAKIRWRSRGFNFSVMMESETGSPRRLPVSPCMAGTGARIPPVSVPSITGSRPRTSAMPTTPHAASTGTARRTTVESAVHRVILRKVVLSRSDPPNYPQDPAWWCRGRRQTACKPGSVPPSEEPRRAVMAIPLGRPLPSASCDRPERRRGGTPGTPDRSGAPAAPTWSCSRWGFPCRRRCRRRGALLPHRFTLAARPACRRRGGGVLSVALSLGSPPPGVTRHRTSVEPGLSSPRERRAAIRPSGKSRFGRSWTICQSPGRGHRRLTASS